MTWGLRAALGLSAGALAAGASAQIGPGLEGAVRALKDHDFVRQPSSNPLQPTGFPGLPEKNLSNPPENLPTFRLLHADHQKYVGNDVVLDGNCEFLVRGFRVTCDHATGNLKTKIFTLSGHVRIDGALLNVEGDEVTVDFDQQTYRATRATSQISPELLQGRLRDKLYVKGAQSSGSAQRTITLNGDFTTCDRSEPHYDIEADQTDVRTGKRIIFRHAKIHLFGHTILALPYLSIPLDDRTYRNTPEVGQSEDEGYFVKNRYQIPLRSDNTLGTREDEMTKLGTGLGANYNYSSRAVRGQLNLYKITGKAQTLTFSNDHQQAFRWGTLDIANDYQRDNYLVAPGTSILNSRISLDLKQGRHGDDRINFSRTSSEATNYSSSNQTIALNDLRDYGNRLTSNLTVNYLTNQSHYIGSASDTHEQLDLRFRGQKELDQATALIEYQRTIPIGQATNFIGSADRTPVVSLASDARRLFGDAASKALPFRTELSIGDFGGAKDASQITRTFFDFNFNKPSVSHNASHLDLNGDFRQGIYSDNTAQYVLNFGSNYRYDLGGNTGVNLRYNYLRPYGYSPLSIDRTGQSNFVSADVNVRPVKPLLIGVQSGYDILRLQQKEIAWQQVGVRGEYRPSQTFMLRTLYTYDTFQQAWTSLRLDTTYVPGAFKLTAAARYDGIRHLWSDANLYMDGLQVGRTRFSAALGYNGFLKQFQTQQYGIIYDLHCAEAIFTLQENDYGFRPGRTMTFFLRLKALPFDLPFGFGTRGQPLGVGTGTDF